MPLFYTDSSALVKLVVQEPETSALRAFLADADLVASELVLVEVPRAVARASARDDDLDARTLVDRTVMVLEAIGLHPVDRAVLVAAGRLPEPALRALDAIHVASAAILGTLGGFVTYDERQSAAARLTGLRTFAPGA